MIKAIDLFAGIGGIRLGFEQVFKEKFNCVFASEINKYAIETYKTNFNNEEVFGDITKITNDCIPKHDILLAGFPCQAFSIAGNRMGFKDNRGILFFEIIRIVKLHRPSVIFLENVKGLINHNKGKTLNIIINSLEDLDYKVYFKLLNAKDFSVPQNRERIYIVAFKDKNKKFTFPNAIKNNINVGKILEPLVDKKYTISDKLWSGHQTRKLKHLKKGNGFGYSLFNSESQYTSTLSARYYKDGSEILIAQENNNPRKITPREAARLQGFPESYKIKVSDSQAYKQFGNTVCVTVIREIAKQIKIALDVE